MTWRLPGGSLCCVGLFALQGCMMEANDPVAAEEDAAGEIASAISPPCNLSVYDSCSGEDDGANGVIHTALFQCKYQSSLASGARQFAVAECAVPSGYVLVGGGADVEGMAPKGALLWISRAASTSTWQAASSDNTVSAAHRLRAYAIGLRIDNVSPGAIAAQIRLSPGTLSPSAGSSSAGDFIPDNHVLLSGGAYAPWGQYLTSSFPLTNGRAWVAAFKDHGVPVIGQGISYAYSLPRCPSFLSFCLDSVILGPGSSTLGTGYRIATVSNSNAQAVVTGIGAASTAASSSGRLLTHLMPNGTGAVVINKDHWWTDNGGVQAYAISLKRL